MSDLQLKSSKDNQRRPILPKVAANEYLDCAGIASHVEHVESFGANLATLSMLQPIEMTLTPAEQAAKSSGWREGLKHC